MKKDRRSLSHVGAGVLVAATAALLSLSPGRANAQTTVSIDANVRYQTIQGFGTCTSSGNNVWNPANWSATSGGNLGYVYARDLGLTVLRLYVEPNTLLGINGVNSLATVVNFTGNATTDAAKINLNQSRTQYQDNAVNWLKSNALETSQFKILTSIWCPPHWMKSPTGATVTDYAGVTAATPFIGNYGNDTIGGTINLSYATQFAYYCSAYIKAIQNATGLLPYGFSIQNEITFENPFNSATYLVNGDFSRYAPTLQAVRNDISKNGWGSNIKLMGPHVAGLGQRPDNPWAIWQQNRFIQSVKNYSDATLFSSLAIYTHHDYMTDYDKSAIMQKAYLDGKASLPGEAWASWVSNADIPGVRNDGKEFWMSEVSGEPNSLDGGLQIAQRLHDSLVWCNTTGYVYWQLCDGSATANEGTLIGTNNLSNPNGSKKYCAFKHYSRYIRPGAQRIKATPSSVYGSNEYNTSNGLNVSAFRHGTNKKITIVLVNRRTTQHSVTLAIANTSIVNNTFEVWRTSSSEGFTKLSNAGVSNNRVTLTVPAKSIVTLYGSIP